MSGAAVAIDTVLNTGAWAAEMGYNHWLNKTNMRRQDNAVQRHMADLRAAGLNPTLAAGGAGAPTGGYVPSTASPEIGPVAKAAELDLLKKQTANLELTALNLQKDIDVKNEEIENMKATREGTRASTAATAQETKFAAIDAARNQDLGLTRNPTAIAAIIRDIIGGLDKTTEIGGKLLPGATDLKTYSQRLKYYLGLVRDGKMSIREAMTAFARENYERNKKK